MFGSRVRSAFYFIFFHRPSRRETWKVLEYTVKILSDRKIKHWIIDAWAPELTQFLLVYKQRLQWNRLYFFHFLYLHGCWKNVNFVKITQFGSNISQYSKCNAHFSFKCPRFNPCAVELFSTIFHSFEAGIANAISSSKWRKIIIFMKEYTSLIPASNDEK